MLDRTAILNAATAAEAPTPVDMPSWGGPVYLRPVTLAQVRAATTAAEAAGLEDATYMLLARCIEQADGTRLFADEDATALEAMPLRTVKPLLATLNAINGFDETAEALAGNSAPTPA
jgi:hypothetical protein